MLDDDFTDDDWRVRFAAVEKATLVFRFLEDRPVKKCPAVRTVLAHAFCCVIASMDDIDVHVGQRATLLSRELIQRGGTRRRFWLASAQGE